MSRTQNRTILIVDDDADIVAATTHLLQAHGYHTLSARDGAAGLALAQRERPDLVILDVMMASETEGIQVSRQLRELVELQDMKVLLVTGIRKAMRLPRAIEPDPGWLPVDEVLEKPVAPQTLLARIAALLA